METPAEVKRGMDERLKVAERMREIVDELEQSVAQGGSLDEAEERVVPLVRKLGVEVLSARARRIAAEVPAPLGVQVRRHSKKSPLADEFRLDRSV